MSVINQMLKDLDKRQQDEKNNVTTGSAVQIISNTKPWLIITITVVITLAVISVGYFFYQNQQLKHTITQNKQAPQSQSQIAKPQKLREQITNSLRQAKGLQNEHLTKPQNVLEKIVPQSNVISSTKPNKAIKPIVQEDKSAQQKTGQINQDAKLNSSELETNQKTAADTLVVVEDKMISQPPKPSMSVSRKRVSAEQLAKQKMAKAEELIIANKPKLAETLFEEIIMLTPNNKAARKQLAALWFGRKAFQSALNLLSQGISLDKTDSEFRLMQARIYLNQGNNEKAYQVLQDFEHSDNIEYLVTLANVAQQLAKYQQAILSYQHLANLQPSEARWWLGLAMAYDSNGQYKLAITAYQAAVEQGNLSKSALQFTKQRLQELEE